MFAKNINFNINSPELKAKLVIPTQSIDISIFEENFQKISNVFAQNELLFKTLQTIYKNRYFCLRKTVFMTYIFQSYKILTSLKTQIPAFQKTLQSNKNHPNTTSYAILTTTYFLSQIQKLQHLTVCALQTTKQTLQENLDSQLAGMWPISAQLIVFSDLINSEFREIAVYFHRIKRSGKFICFNEISAGCDPVGQVWRYLVGESKLPDGVEVVKGGFQEEVKEVVVIEKVISGW